MSDSKVLSLDISSAATGFTVLAGRKILTTGDLHPAGEDHPEKLNHFRVELEKILSSNTIAKVVIEDVYAGKNVRTLKILSYYHGVVMQLAFQYKAEVLIMTPSRWRRILGAIHSCKLNFKEREDSKAAVQSLIKKLFKDMESASEDACDAAGLGLAAVEWSDAFEKTLEVVRSENPKIRSASRLQKIAEEKTEKIFDDLVNVKR